MSAHLSESLEYLGQREPHAMLCSAKNRSILPALYIPPVSVPISISLKFYDNGPSKVCFEVVMLVMILWYTCLRSRNLDNKSVMHYLVNDGFIYILVCFHP